MLIVRQCHEYLYLSHDALPSVSTLLGPNYIVTLCVFKNSQTQPKNTIQRRREEGLLHNITRVLENCEEV
jgi:hypothetical protein